MELSALSNAFQIKPDLENILQSSKVKQLIQEVVGEILLSEISFILFSLHNCNLDIFRRDVFNRQC